jgi:hypothetical protein
MTERAVLALPAELRPWQEHVCACQASGQIMVAYAKAHRLSVQALYRAKARLTRYGAGQLEAQHFQRELWKRRLRGPYARHRRRYRSESTHEEIAADFP